MIQWDTVGKERFRSINTPKKLISKPYRDAHAIVFVYDVSNLDSFLNVKQWLTFFDTQYYTDKLAYKLIIGNKCDLISEKVVDRSTAEEFSISVNIPLIETSAKSDINVEQAFVTMAAEIESRMKNHVSNKNRKEKNNDRIFL